MFFKFFIGEREKVVAAEEGFGGFGKVFHRVGQRITIDIEGPGRIVGIGNSDPMSHGSFQGNTIRTFNSLALAIIAATSGADDTIRTNSDRKPCEIVVKVGVNGIKSAVVRLTRMEAGSPQSASDASGTTPEAHPHDKDERPVD